MPRYDSYDDLISDLDKEGIVDDADFGALDDDDLSFLTPPVVRRAPVAPAKKPRGRPKKAA